MGRQPRRRRGRHIQRNCPRRGMIRFLEFLRRLCGDSAENLHLTYPHHSQSIMYASAQPSSSSPETKKDYLRRRAISPGADRHFPPEKVPMGYEQLVMAAPFITIRSTGSPGQRATSAGSPGHIRPGIIRDRAPLLGALVPPTTPP
eukprot:1186197-Prorocentrum_minimum.AAC.2